jgi:plastocyanin
VGKRASATWALASLLVPFLAASCGLPGAANEHERQVLVDYHFDQYAAVFYSYFPKEVSVHPGDTVVFKQSWSGEPHTVTFGTAVDDVYNVLWKFIKDGPPYPEKPPDDPSVAPALTKLNSLPQAQSQTSSAFGQQGAQPCYVESGPLPDPGDKRCPNRTLKPFTGKQLFYNSGIIPYQGDQGNTYRLPIAADAAPGMHYYTCLIHGVLMSGVVTIAPASQAIPSQADVNSAAQKQLSKSSDPFAKAFKEAQGNVAKTGNLAGVDTPRDIAGSVTEFVPRTVKTKVHQKVTWRIVGDSHTVSFNVPKYLPEITVGKDGAVQYTDQVINAVGGPGFPAPPAPDPSSAPASGGPPDGGSNSGPPPPSPPVHVDAGDYDGRHFLSSGLGGPMGTDDVVTYSVTFTRAGSYKYACLVHPLMVGVVDVQ